MAFNTKGIKRITSSEGEDFYKTPNEVTDVLFKEIYKDKLEKAPSLVCDFACGDGAILNRFKELSPNIKIFGNDIVSRVDGYENYSALDRLFVESEFNNFSLEDTIHLVFNPPFNKGIEILELYSDYYLKNSQIETLSLLMPLRSLEGVRRMKVFKKINPSIILNMMFRPTFLINNGSFKAYFSCVWLVFDKKFKGNETIMKFIDKEEKR